MKRKWIQPHLTILQKDVSLTKVFSTISKKQISSNSKEKSVWTKIIIHTHVALFLLIVWLGDDLVSQSC